MPAYDSSGNYIARGDDPAYTTLGDVYREKSAGAGLPIRWGGDFKDFHDPGHFELDDAQPPPLNLKGVLEPAAPALNLDGLLEPVGAQGEPQSANPPAEEPRTFAPLSHVAVNVRSI